MAEDLLLARLALVRLRELSGDQVGRHSTDLYSSLGTIGTDFAQRPLAPGPDVLQGSSSLKEATSELVAAARHLRRYLDRWSRSSGEDRDVPSPAGAAAAKEAGLGPAGRRPGNVPAGKQPQQKQQQQMLPQQQRPSSQHVQLLGVVCGELAEAQYLHVRPDCSEHALLELGSSHGLGPELYP